MKFLPDAVSNKFGRSLLHLQKSSPKLMFYTGAVGVVGATVLACRATLKMGETLAEIEDLKTNVEMAHVEHDMDPVSNDFDDKKYTQAMVALRIKTILNVTKLYAPSAGLMMISLALLTGSHVTLNKRNASLTAAYASVDQAFTKYRDRVIESLGKDKDDEFRYGVDTVEETVEGKDGKTKVVKHTRVSSHEPSMYARFFDESCQDWKRNPEYNRLFLKCQQSYANDMLKARGHVFLNEVYDALGIPRSQAGAAVGWVLSKDGDNFVDFGVFDDLTNPHVRDFVNGNEPSILLDFNVDGVIWDKI